MKYLKYLLYFILAIILFIAILLVWPKGSIEQQIKNNNIPAIAYGIIENGSIKDLKVIGELEKGVPAKNDAIFNVASITKPVFSLVVLKLIDGGELGLDELLYPFWVDPDLKDDPRHKLLTPRILMSHQSGFLNWRWHHEDKKLAFTFDPGTQYSYSGEGMEYLKNAIQIKTGKNLKELADSLVFDPLDMIDSRLVWDKDMDESRFAKWHDKEGNQYETHKRQDALAADDLMTTLSDLSKFAIYIMNGGGLSESTYKEMISPQVQQNERLAFGLGWELVPQMGDNEYALVHGGSDRGVKARIVVMPKSKRAFIAITNSDNGQKILDRTMVSQFEPGAEILDNIYAPLIWRIIHLPFKLF